jgi:hypothetical protein
MNGLALDGPMLIFALPGRLEGPVCGRRVRLGEDPGHAGGQARGEGKTSAGLLEEATDKLDAGLFVSQLSITISRLGLGWIGEPA